MTKRFRNKSEAAYAEHLTLAGLTYEYERPWGKHRPDFTIERPGTSEIVAIADVKDLHHSDEQEAQLAAGRMISIRRNPAAKTRHLIFSVRPQFEACGDYPCILMLASGGDSLPDPLSVMAAMLGDLTIAIPVTPAEGSHETITQAFYGNGKMVGDNGGPKNTRITAIGLMSAIRPGELISGFSDRVQAFADQFLANGTGQAETDRYLEACERERVRLTAAGYDLETSALQVEYVVNPFATKPFPTDALVKGHVHTWEFSLRSQRFEKTHNWTKAGMQG